jgi:hypothetical protein
VDTSSPDGADAESFATAWAVSLMDRAPADPVLTGPSRDLHRVCLVARTGLSVAGAAIRLAASGADGVDRVDGVAATSDDLARLLAELQFDGNEGPGIEALRLRRPVLVPDVAAAASRWPGYALLASGQGLGAVFSFPLHEGAVCFGVLELYDLRPRRLSAEEMARATALSRIATQRLLEPHMTGRLGDLEPGVSKSLERAVVYQAQGMVMVDLGVTLAEAMVRMRGRAFSENLSLDELARRIVDGGETTGSWRDGINEDHQPGDTDG